MARDCRSTGYVRWVGGCFGYHWPSGPPPVGRRQWAAAPAGATESASLARHTSESSQRTPPARSRHKSAAPAARDAARRAAAPRPAPCWRRNRPGRTAANTRDATASGNRWSNSGSGLLGHGDTRAERLDLAARAIGVARVTPAPAMPDQQVTEQRPLVLRHLLH